MTKSAKINDQGQQPVANFGEKGLTKISHQSSLNSY